MNVIKLNEISETIGTTGTILSSEDIAVLKNSLILLQVDNHFKKIFFLGIIYGTEKDYYIAYGFPTDALKTRKYFYSTNCVDWYLLPKQTSSGMELTPLCTGRFKGDPTLLHNVTIENCPNSSGDALQTKTVKTLKEESRLAATIKLLSEDTFVVPRAALLKQPDGTIVENMSFRGIPQCESAELTSYLHFRVPQQRWNTNLLTRPDYNYSFDFLDTIDKDVPDGCWTLHVNSDVTLAILRSLYWPGFTFYHKIETPDYGFLYFGDGKKNLNIPFMLHTW